MKSVHLKTHDKLSCIIYPICRKLDFLVFFVFLMQNATAAVALRSFDYPGNETDYAALLAIKSQLVDRPDGVLSSWNNSVQHCMWDGVVCGRKHKRVTALYLYARGLSGTISPFIANLSFLHTISLSNNSLYGHIPEKLSDLFRLENLGLANNTLVGEIPANLSNCINLRFVELQYNHLEGKLPSGLRELSKLIKLSISNNNLIGPLFDIVQNLTSLHTISAGSNSFTGTIPNSIGRMQNLSIIGIELNKLYGTLPVSLFNLSLRVLDLGFNQFNGELPSHMGFSASSLMWLSVASNKFSGSFPTITNFTSLQYIQFDRNNFTGRIPSDFRQFHNLRALVLSDNYLEGDIKFISTLVNCTQLIMLELDSNNFYGVLPKDVANLSTTLKHLTVGDSLISGTIPAGITGLVNLQTLILRRSKLTRTIPHELGKLYKLQFLDLNSNRLTGNIPNSLGNLSHLSGVYLKDNQLEEGIPQSIRNCKSLLYADLSHNELNRTLENNLFQGSAMFVEIDLSNNHLEGPLPLEIRKQKSLAKLIVSKNKLSGVLPDGLSECTELQHLYIDGNSFRGGIPSSYASLSSLQEINFSWNNLSGPIPTFLSRIHSIYYLDLSHNDFQGRVPTNSVFANASGVFLVGNSRLCGGIPELHLPKCTEKESIGIKKTLKLIIIPVISGLSAIVGVLVMVIGIYLACFRKKTTPVSSDLRMGKTFMKVSYDMLLKATGGFSSENLLGSGSFGSVFKGVLDGQTVAVKVFNLEHHAAHLAECKTLRNVRHRNLVGIITDCSSIDFQRNDFRALVYEFMPNGSLDRWLSGVIGNMSLQQRVSVAIDVAHALNYLHHECENPIVHCDLKPSNVLLDNDMVAHVGDFGLARLLIQPRHPNQSSTIGIMGTIGYAAPEYGLGSEASTDGDIYSYDILLLELMTGKSPTDNLFKDDYNLHMYAEETLPDQVLQIVDPQLEEDNLTEETEDSRTLQDVHHGRVECIISVISVGVSCSNPLPQDRMKIPDAISRLQTSKDKLLNARNRRNLPARG